MRREVTRGFAVARVNIPLDAMKEREGGGEGGEEREGGMEGGSVLIYHCIPSNWKSHRTLAHC